MKRVLSLVLAALLAVSAFSFGARAEGEEMEVYEGFKIADSSLSINVDGKEDNLKFYLLKWIEETDDGPSEKMMNVIKLRDIAKAFEGTDGKFAIDWNKAEGTVEITKGEDYAELGTEFAPVDFATADIQKSECKFTVDGEEVQINSWVINRENYVQISTFKKAMNNFRYRPDFKDGSKNYISFDKSDITAFDMAKYNEVIGQKDFTVVYSWGPWCYWSKLSRPRMYKLQETIEKEYPNVQIFGLVNNYTDYTVENIKALDEGKDVPWTEVGGTKEAYEYFEKVIDYSMNWFPTIFIVDKEGKMVGKSFGETWDVVEQAYADAHGLNVEDEWEDEVFFEMYDSIFDAFIKQVNEPLEEKVEEKKEEAKEEEKAAAVEILFPEINEELLKELEEGKKPYLFVAEDLVKEYVAKENPEAKFEIKEQKEEGDHIIFTVAVEGKEDVMVKLMKNPVKIGEEEKEIWVVIK